MEEPMMKRKRLRLKKSALTVLSSVESKRIMGGGQLHGGASCSAVTNKAAG